MTMTQPDLAIKSDSRHIWYRIPRSKNKCHIRVLHKKLPLKTHFSKMEGSASTSPRQFSKFICHSAPHHSQIIYPWRLPEVPLN